MSGSYSLGYAKLREPFVSCLGSEKELTGLYNLQQFYSDASFRVGSYVLPIKLAFNLILSHNAEIRALKLPQELLDLLSGREAIDLTDSSSPAVDVGWVYFCDKQGELKSVKFQKDTKPEYVTEDVKDKTLHGQVLKDNPCQGSDRVWEVVPVCDTLSDEQRQLLYQLSERLMMLAQLAHYLSNKKETTDEEVIERITKLNSQLSGESVSCDQGKFKFTKVIDCDFLALPTPDEAPESNSVDALLPPQPECNVCCVIS